MTKKKQLTLPGFYRFSMSASHNQHLIHSVFEYQQIRDILACLDDSELVAFTLLEDEMHWVMKCELDWQMMIEQLSIKIKALHKNIWQVSQSNLSNHVEAHYIETPKNIVPCVMQLHYLPVTKGLVASPEMYEFSSDKFYRQEHPPHWLHLEPVLSRLAHQRFHRALRYERVCEIFDYQQVIECHDKYDAFASDEHIQQLLQRKSKQSQAIQWEQILLWQQQAQELVCQRLGYQIEAVTVSRHNRQQVHQQQHVFSLVSYLLSLKGVSVELTAHVLQQDELIIHAWLRSVHKTHPESFIQRLSDSWQPKKTRRSKKPVTETLDDETSNQPEDNREADTNSNIDSALKSSSDSDPDPDPDPDSIEQASA